MKVLVIFTGGTIGSTMDEKWISVNTDTKYKLIYDYQSKYHDETEFETISPYYILSENLSANELNSLYKCIKENLDKNYDGIIVTHGTDTLQYTSSAMGFLFPDIKIPVVFVSSAYPLEHLGENGSYNFAAAVNFIKSGQGKGVFVSYKNDGENKVNIHIATRIKAHGEASADVYSIDNNPYAYYTGSEVVLNDRCTKGEFDKSKLFSGFCKYPKILMIETMPGNSYGYSLDNCKAVILSPYHSATLDVANQNFVDLCVKADEKNIPVFLVNVPTGIRYESVKKLDELKIISLPFCSKIAVYMKCWIAISDEKNVADYVLKPIAQEFIENI